MNYLFIHQFCLHLFWNFTFKMFFTKSLNIYIFIYKCFLINTSSWRIGEHQILIENPHTRTNKKSNLNENSKKLEVITMNVFITNFPKSITSKDLWNLCERNGSVGDVYIAMKLLKLSKRFAFVRFWNPKTTLI